MVELKDHIIKTVRFPMSDFIAVEALMQHTGIAFSGHLRAALKLYLRENKRLVDEALQASMESTTVA